MQLIRKIFLIVVTAVFHRGLCHPDGAPSSKCEDMEPSHGVPPQTRESPYEIKVMKSYYMPGRNVRVSIESYSDDIKGYLIQARQMGANVAIGTFSMSPANGKYLHCGNSKVRISYRNVHCRDFANCSSRDKKRVEGKYTIIIYAFHTLSDIQRIHLLPII